MSVSLRRNYLHQLRRSRAAVGFRHDGTKLTNPREKKKCGLKVCTNYLFLLLAAAFFPACFIYIFFALDEKRDRPRTAINSRAWAEPLACLSYQSHILPIICPYFVY